jgi:hypothetical protein
MVLICRFLFHFILFWYRGFCFGEDYINCWLPCIWCMFLNHFYFSKLLHIKWIELQFLHCMCLSICIWFCYPCCVHIQAYAKLLSMFLIPLPFLEGETATFLVIIFGWLWWYYLNQSCHAPLVSKISCYYRS